MNTVVTENGAQGLAQARETTATIKEWVGAASEIAEAGKSLSEIHEVLDGVSGFGEASAALGVLSVGLELATLIMGGPSPEEQIMEMIVEVSHQIDRLSTKIDNSFAKAAAYGDKVNAQNLMLPHTDAIEDVMHQINTWQGTPAGNEKEDLKKNLLAFVNPQSLIDHVQDLERRITTPDPSQNILIALNTESFGAMRLVSSAGLAVLNSVAKATTAYCTIKVLHAEAAGDAPAPSAYYAASFQPHLKTIADRIGQECQDCFDKTNENIHKRLKHSDIFSTINVTRYTDASTRLRDILAGAYHWVNWEIVVFYPVTGWNMNASFGGQHRLEFLRQHCENDQKASFVINWYDPVPRDPGLFGHLFAPDYAAVEKGMKKAGIFREQGMDLRYLMGGILGGFRDEMFGRSMIVILAPGVSVSWSNWGLKADREAQLVKLTPPNASSKFNFAKNPYQYIYVPQ